MEEKSNPTLSFEAALSELETIVRQLEEGKIPLEDAVKAYEKGSYLRKLCEEKLNEARLRIEKITTSSESGEPQMEIFEEINGS